MGESVTRLLDGMVGLVCTRRAVGEWRGLSLGFGEEERGKKIGKSGIVYREWEISAYFSSWRMIRNGRFLFGNKEEKEVLIKCVEEVELGAFVAIKRLSEWDVRVELDSGVSVDFLATRRDDASFQVSMPGTRWLTFTAEQGWMVSKSNVNEEPVVFE